MFEVITETNYIDGTYSVTKDTFNTERAAINHFNFVHETEICPVRFDHENCPDILSAVVALIDKSTGEVIAMDCEI